MKKKIFCKKNIKWFVLFFLIVVYIAVYAYLYSNAVKPDIRYYEKGTVIEWGGLEYSVKGEIYSLEEFLEKYQLEKYQLSSVSTKYERKYIVAEMEIKKLREDYDEELNGYRYLNIYSKYWQSGVEIDGEAAINSERTSIEDLEVGEKTTLYKVFDISENNHNEKVWNNAKNEKVWFEFTDNEKYQYVTRVKILN